MGLPRDGRWYKTVNAAQKATCLEPNPLDLLVKGIDAQESESHLGIEVYFENQGVKYPSCPHTRKDVVVPMQAFEEHIRKSAMVYESIDMMPKNKNTTSMLYNAILFFGWDSFITETPFLCRLGLIQSMKRI
jgi:hypothetical protein